MKTIGREDLRAKIESPETDLVLLEVLSESSYEQGHLPGATRFPGKAGIPGLLPDRTTTVVAYCSNSN